MTPIEPFEVRPPVADETVFRVLQGDEASAEEFLSDEQTGKRRTLDTSQSVAIYRGFSVRRTYPQAMSLAALLGKRRVAEIVLISEEGDAIARTLKTRGHHTLWADPTAIANRSNDIHNV